jgi:hypothetical protein
MRMTATAALPLLGIEVDAEIFSNENFHGDRSFFMANG